ncbi:GMC oxidoreductase [Pseudonocardia sp. T1-2H]|uniref:GMC oxidoreductase n=1 Tax=Pseudonocardia sp. T1-2H TaxID=3128899 RepID=UPI00405405A2
MIARAASTSRWTRRTTSRASSGCACSCRAGSGTWACTRSTCCTTASTCTKACRSAPPRTRPAPSGSAPTRRSSALDVNCKAHELDNLYVVDTSFFPSIGAVNPSLTAIANALRVGDHLIDRLG